MHLLRSSLPLGLALLTLTLAAGPAAGDEGMWLLNNPPLKTLAERHNFTPSPAWMEHAQKSAVRFQTGGSGSLISADGLVMTNHHVGSDMLLKLSTKSRDLLKDGFLARTRADELACPDLELNILWQIQDVTAKVLANVTPGMPAADAGKARREAIAAIEKAAKDATGLSSEVVTLYGGAQYHLYQYKSYTDIRLVFAPEESIAFFGGDTDNFEFPRYNLDCCFFRIYDKGQPLKAEHYLTWSPSGAAEGDLAIVIGHPGRTERLHTYDHLRHTRDVELPARMADLWRAEIKAQTFAGRSAENARIVRDDLFGIANGRKARTGMLEGLQDPALMAAKKADEAAFRAAVDADAALKPRYASAWDDIAKVKQIEWPIVARKRLLDNLSRSQLMGRAVTLVRLAAELPKPNSERLAEFGDARLDALYLDLYSPAPIYDALEVHTLAQAFALAAERLGADDPAVTLMLDGKSPTARAEQLVRASTLRDPADRKTLAANPATIAASNDPMIQLARALDPEARALRKQIEDTIEAPLRDAYAKIGAARFAILGNSVYPDATFTLRLAFGPIKGYTEPDGTQVPAFTKIGGTFLRAQEREGQEGFTLPPSWLKAKPALNADTPFNFICTADIIGGNSGSPVLNTRGQVIGLIFDGNIHSLVSDFIYNPTTGRAVAVDSRGIIESLRSVYQADTLVKEITGK